MTKRSSVSGRSTPSKRAASKPKVGKKSTLPKSSRGAARIVTRAHKGAFKELKKH